MKIKKGMKISTFVSLSLPVQVINDVISVIAFEIYPDIIHHYLYYTLMILSYFIMIVGCIAVYRFGENAIKTAETISLLTSIIITIFFLPTPKGFYVPLAMTVMNFMYTKIIMERGAKK